jgi:hypothetical protein
MLVFSFSDSMSHAAAAALLAAIEPRARERAAGEEPLPALSRRHEEEAGHSLPCRKFRMRPCCRCRFLCVCRSGFLCQERRSAGYSSVICLLFLWIFERDMFFCGEVCLWLFSPFENVCFWLHRIDMRWNRSTHGVWIFLFRESSFVP